MKLITKLLILLTIAAASHFAFAQPNLEEGGMSVRGTFEVNLEPQADEQMPVGRMLIDKKYHGGLDGSGLGQMISKRTEGGAAFYSAVEEFKGTLEGKRGSFTLVHVGWMSAEGQALEVEILDGSGSGELEGISGSMDIIREGESHQYVLEYEM